MQHPGLAETTDFTWQVNVVLPQVCTRYPYSFYIYSSFGSYPFCSARLRLLLFTTSTSIRLSPLCQLARNALLDKVKVFNRVLQIPHFSHYECHQL